MGDIQSDDFLLIRSGQNRVSQRNFDILVQARNFVTFRFQTIISTEIGRTVDVTNESILRIPIILEDPDSNCRTERRRPPAGWEDRAPSTLLRCRTLCATVCPWPPPMASRGATADSVALVCCI